MFCRARARNAATSDRKGDFARAPSGFLAFGPGTGGFLSAMAGSLGWTHPRREAGVRGESTDRFDAGGRRRSPSQEHSHDPKAVEGRVPALLAEEEPEDGASPQPRHVLDAGRREEARARGAVLQAALS